MKNLIMIFSVLFLTVMFCDTQAQFQWVIGGSLNEVAYSIIQTSDNGYAVAGKTESFGAVYESMYIVKLSSSGTIQWTKTIGGGGTDRAESIKQTADGGYIIAGITGSFGAGGGDFYIVKLDAGGNLLWSRTLGGTNYDYAYSIVETKDSGVVSGFAVAGVTYSFGTGVCDMYIVKLNESGIIQWSKTIGGTGAETAQSLIQTTTDEGFVLAGQTTSFGAGGSDFYIVKLDRSGVLQWSKTIGGTGYEKAYSVVQSLDGGYAIAGMTQSFGAGMDDNYIVKLDGGGNLLWSRTVGGTNNDWAFSITKTNDGGFAVTGNGDVSPGGILVTKLDGNGSLQLSKKVAIPTSGFNLSYSIIQTSDLGYAVAGIGSTFGPTDFYIIKFDNNWNTCANSAIFQSISGTGGISGSPVSITTSPTTIVTTPTSTVGSGGTITQLCNTSIQNISNEIPTSAELYQNYPNPFNPTTKIRFDITISSNTILKVYDAKGEVVETLVNEKLIAGKYEIDWNAAIYPSGVYFYKLETEDFTSTKKMILIK